MLEIKGKNFAWEAIIQTTKEDSISADNKGINSPESHEITSVYARAITDSRQGVMFSSNANSLKSTILEAYKIAKLSPKKDDISKITSRAVFLKKEFNYNYFSDKELVESTEEIKKIIDNKAPLIEFAAKKEKVHTKYVNYLGASIDYKGDALGFEVGVGEGHMLGVNTSMISSKKPDLKSLAAKALNDYENSKNLARPASGNYPVIIADEALLNIAMPVLFSLKGESVCEKKSKFQNSFGKEELSRDLTIIDNPFEPNNKSYFDFEGNKAKKTALVKNGVINSFIHDSCTSKKLGMPNTNNSASMAIKPSTSYHCISIKGKDRLSQMVKSIKSGFLMYGTYPSHTINKTTGAFGQNSSTFYYIKNGEIQGLSKGYVVIGNSYKAFKNDLEISKETRNDLGANAGAVKINAKVLKN